MAGSTRGTRWPTWSEFAANSEFLWRAVLVAGNVLYLAYGVAHQLSVLASYARQYCIPVLVKLFNVNDGTVLRTFTHHTDWVHSLALLPDGLRFVSGSDDHTARIVEHGLAPFAA